MTELERFRSDVPELGMADVRAEERRLLSVLQDTARRPERPTARAPRRAPRRHRLRIGLAGAGLAAAAVAAGAVVVTTGGDPEPSPIVHTMPVASVQVLERAADNAARTQELHPKPGQFLVFESRSMNPVEGSTGGHEERYLERTKSKTWLPVEGHSTRGVAQVEVLAPKPYPGWPIPPEARRKVGWSAPERIGGVDNRAEHLRNDYAYLSRLPADPAKMYQHLYTGLGTGPQADVVAWQNVGNMLSDAYMPAAQRAALFRAAGAIHGVTTVGHAVDAAGRTGVAVALTTPDSGIRDEYIFDEDTYQYLGQRVVVTNAAQGGAPVGTVLTNSAQLKVSVADRAPAVD
ncbi:hypothetical protein F8568_043375 [Actinomadura sp. LD22]|uniref:CU044_5270 family protein n=2 Tax=Thermomonosporaceae TaxID=2012 RepID=A0A6I4MLH3_9ACTN|nr:hypothetical protein [Actinomadura physcomitrii]